MNPYALKLAELLCSQPHTAGEMAEIITGFLRAHEQRVTKPLKYALEMSYQELFRSAPNSTTFAVVTRALGAMLGN